MNWKLLIFILVTTLVCLGSTGVSLWLLASSYENENWAGYEVPEKCSRKKCWNGTATGTTVPGYSRVFARVDCKGRRTWGPQKGFEAEWLAHKNSTAEAEKENCLKRGIIGLENPNPDPEHACKWDPERYVCTCPFPNKEWFVKAFRASAMWNDNFCALKHQEVLKKAHKEQCDNPRFNDNDSMITRVYQWRDTLYTLFVAAFVMYSMSSLFLVAGLCTRDMNLACIAPISSWLGCICVLWYILCTRSFLNLDVISWSYCGSQQCWEADQDWMTYSNLDMNGEGFSLAKMALAFAMTGSLMTSCPVCSFFCEEDEYDDEEEEENEKRLM